MPGHVTLGGNNHEHSLEKQDVQGYNNKLFIAFLSGGKYQKNIWKEQDHMMTIQYNDDIILTFLDGLVSSYAAPMHQP